MSAPAVSAEEQVRHVRNLLSDTHLTLDVAGAAEANRSKARVLTQIDDFLLPRLADLEAPLLVVVGGSTGAGKSTIVNTIVGQPVSPSSAIRPTTRRPLLVANESEMPSFRGDRVLGGLHRVSAGSPPSELHQGPLDGDGLDGGPPALSVGLHVSASIPNHMALLDAPDIDSLSDANRTLAKQLLDAADLWLFVTTAARYADAAAWSILDEAAARGIVVAVVLNRVPPGAADQVAEDLRALMTKRGLSNAPLFVIDEVALPPSGLLPEQATAQLETWLRGVVLDRETRLAVARAAVAGALRNMQAETDAIAAALQTQDAALQDMRQTVETTYDNAANQVLTATTDGSLLRSEILDRWQDFVGTSDVFRSFEKWVASVGDRVSGWLRGSPAPVQEVEREITGGVTAVLIDEAGQSASQVWRQLHSSPAGQELFTDPALRRETDSAPMRAATQVRAWQDDLLNMVREETPKKRQKARALSLGLNTLTVALMLVVFASTGGLLGGEIAIAGGSAVIGQKLLETIFGDQAIRKLSEQAAQMLKKRTEEFFDIEADRYLDIIDAVAQGTTPSQLRKAAGGLGLPEAGVSP